MPELAVEARFDSLESGFVGYHRQISFYVAGERRGRNGDFVGAVRTARKWLVFERGPLEREEAPQGVGLVRARSRRIGCEQLIEVMLEIERRRRLAGEFEHSRREDEEIFATAGDRRDIARDSVNFGFRQRGHPRRELVPMRGLLVRCTARTMPKWIRKFATPKCDVQLRECIAEPGVAVF